jgi:hypothetical protein
MLTVSMNLSPKRKLACCEGNLSRAGTPELMGLHFRVGLALTRQFKLLPAVKSNRKMVDSLMDSVKLRFDSDALTYPIDDSIVLNESPMRFLSIHFRLLQSLYNDSGEFKSDSDENDPYTSSSGVIDDTIWDRIQDFMEQREFIYGDRQQMREMSEVCRELTHYTYASPLHSGRPSDALRDPPSQPVSIIASLLQQRFHCFQAKVDLPTRTCRYEALLQDLQHHVQSLNSQLEQCVSWMRHAQLGTNATTTVPATIDRSWMAELDYKIQLWSLLMQDLKTILAPSQDIEIR